MHLKELPQELLGLIITKVTKAEYHVEALEGIAYYEPSRFNKSRWGISLGSYIICNKPTRTTLKHERGHSLQSKRYGWMYLLIVGVPSIVRNIWDRLMHKKWTPSARITWYYSGWPEKQADELGKVARTLLYF